jgi:membrane-associated phospholipid phosphatase
MLETGSDKARPRITVRPAKLAAAALLAVAVLTASPGAAANDSGPGQGQAAFDRSTVVAGWIERELGEIVSHRTNPPRAARALALVSVAMLDASRAARSQRNAVVAGAAATVLAYLFPDRAAAFDELAARERPRTAVTLGRVIGARVVARAQNDGSDAVWQGSVPFGPGLWVPTPPAFAPPLEPLVGTWRTWNLRSGGQFRPGPPTAFGTPGYAVEIREVYDVSRVLTDEQKRIADFWADGPGTVTPPGHWDRIALDLIRSHRLGATAAAQVLAALNTAQADAFIACWDAKFTYWSERPVTAIRRELSPGWLPYIPTPPFPAYVSGHSTTSGAASEVLAAYFPSAARRLRAWAQEAAVSRLYGGIHFRSDNEAGLVLGRKVARATIARYAAAAVERTAAG